MVSVVKKTKYPPIFRTRYKRILLLPLVYSPLILFHSFQPRCFIYNYRNKVLWGYPLEWTHNSIFIFFFFFFSENSCGKRFRGEQFLLSADSDRVLFPHDGWAWGSGGHCGQNCWDGLHAAPSGQSSGGSLCAIWRHCEDIHGRSHPVLLWGGRLGSHVHGGKRLPCKMLDFCPISGEYYGLDSSG